MGMKYLRGSVVAILLSLLASVPLVANEYPHSLGVQVGRLSGIGASYQAWTQNIGWQVGGGVLYNTELDEYSDRLVYNLGLELQYPLVEHAINKWLEGKLYLVLGVHHQGYEEAVETSLGSGVYTAGPLQLNFGLGGGIGVETILFEHFAIGTEFVYVGMYNPKLNETMVNMFPQVSLRYRFSQIVAGNDSVEE